jgi:putative endonuclease
MKQYYVYILTNKRNGTLYIGVTNNLKRRIFEHKEKQVEGFTKIYGVDKLVYFEMTENVSAAIEREKRLKEWQRGWKLKLIEKENQEWRDLYDEI